MPEWIVGVVGSVAGVGVVALLAALVKRAALYERAWKWGTALRNIGLGYDLPVIGGDAETTFKDRFLSSLSDFLRGLARGIAGKPLAEDGE